MASPTKHLLPLSAWHIGYGLSGVLLGVSVGCTGHPPKVGSGSAGAGESPDDLGGERPLVEPRVAEDVDGDGFDDVTDCQTLDSSVHPAAVEVEGNGVDENCDGFDRVLPTTSWTEVVVEWSTDDPAVLHGEDARITTNFQRVLLHDGREVVLGLAWINPEPGKGLSFDEVMEINGESLGTGVRSGSIAQVSEAYAKSVVVDSISLDVYDGLGIAPFGAPLGDVDADGLPELMVDPGTRAEWAGDGTVSALGPSRAVSLPMPTVEGAGCEEGCWVIQYEESSGILWLSFARPIDGSVLGWEPVGEEICVRAEDHFAATIAGGDVNGDGVRDMLVHARIPDSELLGVEVYLGPISAAQLCGAPDLRFLGPPDGLQFTQPHVRGDVNGNGTEDVWVRIAERGREAYLRGAYAVFDLAGRSGDIDLSEALFTVQPNRVDGSYIGQVEVDDWDGDGHMDLMVGAFPALHPSREGAQSRGSVALFRGPLSGNLYYDAADVVWSGPGFDDGFGAGFLLGEDWDGDGQQDLLVGAPFSSWDPDFRGKVWFTPFVVPPAD